jgi:hypothetical protein
MLNNGIHFASVASFSPGVAPPKLFPRRGSPVHHAFGPERFDSRVESQLGFRLFDRTTRHVGLTSCGDELIVGHTEVI